MKSYDRIIPDGTRDILFDDCRRRRTMEDSLRALYRGYAYTEVMTPSIEFYDMFAGGVGRISQNEMYTLTDSYGRLLVLRPDSTKPIARLYASRLQSINLPLRLFYNQAVYRRNINYCRKSDESMQMGVELIGGEGFKADAEVLALAAETLGLLFGEDYAIELGHSSFVRDAVAAVNCGEREREQLKLAVLAKNRPEIRKLAGESDAGGRLLNLIDLFGPQEQVLADAERVLGEDNQALKRIKMLCSVLSGMGLGGKLILDLASVSEHDYYTGMVFKGFVGGLGQEVLSGGRYDTLYGDYGLSIAATGFALDENAADAALSRRADNGKEPSLVVLFCGKGDVARAFSAAGKVAKAGRRCELSLEQSFEKTIEYARLRGAAAAAELLSDGSLREVTLK